MDITSLFPMPPWLGPPFPQGLGIYWPWAQGGQIPTSTFNVPPTKDQPAYSPPSAAYQDELPAYENTEKIEFPDGFDQDSGMPRSIVIHRRYKVRSDG